MQMYVKLFVALMVLFSITACPVATVESVSDNRDTSAGGGATVAIVPNPEPFDIDLAKWYSDHAAAISLTYDDVFYMPHNKAVMDLVVKHDSFLEFELVTELIMEDLNIRKQLLEIHNSKHFLFFGHGNDHWEHDLYSYEECLKSFSSCFMIMDRLDMKPFAYAYPHSSGWNESTQRALEEAGFYLSRMHEPTQNLNDEYLIMEDDKIFPADGNWFELPSLVMQSYDFEQDPNACNNNAEFIGFLNRVIEKKAWVIPTYHSIGNKQGWGFYELAEFEKDLITIKSMDLWHTSMENVYKYVTERNGTTYTYDPIKVESGKETHFITFDDLKDDVIFNHPLTIYVTIPPAYNMDLLKLEIFKNDVPVAFEAVSKNRIKLDILPDTTAYKLVITKK